MSILNDNPTPVISDQVRTSEKSYRVKRDTIQITDALINSVTSRLKHIWEDPTPQGVIDQLGTDAEEIFQFIDNTTLFLNTELSGKRDEDLVKIQAAVNLIQPYTVSANGTISID